MYHEHQQSTCNQQETNRAEPDLFKIRREFLEKCIADYFSHTSPADLMCMMQKAMPQAHEIDDPEKMRINLEAWRMGAQLFEFLTRLERIHLSQ